MSGATPQRRDFGFREGYAQLGSYRVNGGLQYIYALWGVCESPAAGTLWAWIAVAGPYLVVTMKDAYEPVYVRNYPTRAAVRGGDTCSFPDIEANALIAAGIAVASGS